MTTSSDLIILRQCSCLLAESPTIILRQSPGATTSAFVISPLSHHSPFLFKAVTTEVEHRQFQPNFTVLYLALSDQFPQSRSFKPISQHYYRFVLTADLNQAIALKDYNDGW